MLLLERETESDTPADCELEATCPNGKITVGPLGIVSDCETLPFTLEFTPAPAPATPGIPKLPFTEPPTLPPTLAPCVIEPGLTETFPFCPAGGNLPALISPAALTAAAAVPKLVTLLPFEEDVPCETDLPDEDPCVSVVPQLCPSDTD